jgi:hypothetical protein
MDAVVFDTLHDDATLDGVPVRGMFSAPWLAPELGGRKTGIVEPQIVLLDADAKSANKGSIVEFDGDAYTVVSVQPDGTGVTTLILRPVG